MNRNKLLRRMSALGFAMYEYRLFCDTHPDNIEAQQLFEETRKKYLAVKEEYEKEFGPITLNGYNSDEWLKDPWPWENEAN